MIANIPKPGPHATELAERILALVLLALVIALLGHTYVGHSPSPYGVCYGGSGRSIPCAVAASGRSAHRPPNGR